MKKNIIQNVVILVLAIMTLLLTSCEQPIKQHIDNHGCNLDEKYWCESRQECIINSETCKDTLTLKAEELCKANFDGKIFRCEKFVRTFSNVPGTPTKFYLLDGNEVSCPVYYKHSEECQKLLSELDKANCVNVC